MKIIDCKILQHTAYVYRMDMYDEARLMHCVICIVTTNLWVMRFMDQPFEQ